MHSSLRLNDALDVDLAPRVPPTTSIPPRVCAGRLLDYCDAWQWALSEKWAINPSEKLARVREVVEAFFEPDAVVKIRRPNGTLINGPAHLLPLVYVYWSRSLKESLLVPGGIKESYCENGNVVVETANMTCISLFDNGCESQRNGSLKLVFNQSIKIVEFDSLEADRRVNLTMGAITRILDTHKLEIAYGEQADLETNPIERVQRAVDAECALVTQNSISAKQYMERIKMEDCASTLGSLFDFMHAHNHQSPLGKCNADLFRFILDVAEQIKTEALQAYSEASLSQ